MFIVVSVHKLGACLFLINSYFRQIYCTDAHQAGVTQPGINFIYTQWIVVSILCFCFGTHNSYGYGCFRILNQQPLKKVFIFMNCSFW